MRGDSTAQVALEVPVVQPAKERLNQDEKENYDANYGVVVDTWVRELLFVSKDTSITGVSPTRHPRDPQYCL